MLLSPHAPPFHPTYEPVHLAVYNNGVPSLVFVNEHEVLRDMDDLAIDEGFPPDALDAAELETVERFVQLQAEIALMEEREEQARLYFVGFGKRWEARRVQGATNVKRYVAETRGHHNIRRQRMPHATITTLMQHQHHQRMHQKFGAGANMSSSTMTKGNHKVMNARKPMRAPIQQPRKFV